MGTMVVLLQLLLGSSDSDEDRGYDDGSQANDHSLLPFVGRSRSSGQIAFVVFHGSVQPRHLRLARDCLRLAFAQKVQHGPLHTLLNWNPCLCLASSAASPVASRAPQALPSPS